MKSPGHRNTPYHMELYMSIETLLDFRDKVRISLGCFLIEVLIDYPASS
jgi:hypothetical protein